MSGELLQGTVLLEPGVMVPASPTSAAQEDPESRQEGSYKDADPCNDPSCHTTPGATVNTLVPEGKKIPQIIQTNELSFDERCRAYQDYILVNCKASEVKEFIASFLEKVLEPSGWCAVWRTELFEVLVEVTNVNFSALKAVVRLSEPFVYESQCCDYTLDDMKGFLDRDESQRPLQELWVVSDDSQETHQKALAIEHVRFFYENIWRGWDEEEEDEYGYFVRCVEPRLRLYYDILEDRVPSGHVHYYQYVLGECEFSYIKYLNLMSSSLTTSNYAEQSKMLMEGLNLFSDIEFWKRHLKLFDNPLLRYLFGYPDNFVMKPKGTRQNGQKVTHVVSSTMKTGLLRSLFRDRFCEESCKEEETEIQFHSDMLSAINACHEGDTVIICPGHYVVHGTCTIADSIELEGYGLPDDIVIEKKGKGGPFVDCKGMEIKISSIKFIQHDSVEGMLRIWRGKTTLENCVLQCETTGVIVHTTAELFMKNSVVYGAKGAGIEIYPETECTLTDNEIHHCKEGILVKGLLTDCYDPKISLINNILHNNEGYGVAVVTPTGARYLKENAQDELNNNTIQENREVDATEEGLDLEERLQGVANKMEHSATDDFSEQAKGSCETITEPLPTSTKKGQVKKRLSKPVIIEAEGNITSEEIFVEITGNQFKRNGKGGFGIFRCILNTS
ncbi:SHC SH2 domain-binding protein 1-like [Phodopus roborovskii]|uniref:SHC SH2 domain-binding protein 1-like n=1 Tax=Phodopus roborovskii TaxID=109678 RepID=UPI0021E41175|nr:SHC SH2 domain-binding protein 1-like [Phodopus roborovskii]